MFVRFPIILARPTSLRGSQSPGPWPQVTGGMPGGGRQNSGLSGFCCFWCNNHGKIPGRAGWALCSVCVPVSLLCAGVSCSAVCPVLPSPSCSHQSSPAACWVWHQRTRVSEGAAIRPVQAPHTGMVLHPLSVLPSCHHPLVSVLSLSSHPCPGASLCQRASRPALPG